MKTHWVFLALLPLALALTLAAAEPGAVDKPGKAGKPAKPVNLGKTLRLTFQIGTEEPFTMNVVTAGGAYQGDSVDSNLEQEHSVNVSGEVVPSDDPAKVCLSFLLTRMTHDKNRGDRRQDRLVGSALMRVDKQLVLGKLGDDPVTLKLKVED